MPTNKAILVVSFGTSHTDTLNKTILNIENTIKNKYKDHKIYRAFTSKMIINKLKNEYNVHVNTVAEAMRDIVNDGINELIVQPTHIINGIENDLMIEDVNRYINNFNCIKFGTPLLTTTDDYFNVIKVLTTSYDITDKTALVLMGHGTSHHANAVYPALDYTFKEQGFNNIFVGTVEGYPNINQIIKKVKEFNPHKIILLPFMLVAGEHATNDMAGENPASWKNQFEAIGYKVLPILKGLGELDGICNIYLEHLENAK